MLPRAQRRPPLSPTAATEQPGAAFAVICGGGTGGHLMPGLAVAEALCDAGHLRESIHFVGARRGLEATAVPAAGFEVHLFAGRGLLRRLDRAAIAANARAIMGLLAGAAGAVVLMAGLRPRVVVSTGGYAAVPGVLAAALLGIPIVVVDTEVCPGAASRLATSFASLTAVTVPGATRRRAVCTGAPLRRAVSTSDRSEAGRAAARRALGLPLDGFVLGVLGGSLGARRINEAVAGFARASRRDPTLSICHVAGERDRAMVEGAAVALLAEPGTELSYVPMGFCDRMDLIYAASDLVLCRAGSITIAELTALGVPAILVPLPGAPSDHQRKNALELERAGAAVLCEDQACTASRLAEIVAGLRQAPGRLEQMATAARRLGRPDAASHVALLVEAAAATTETHRFGWTRRLAGGEDRASARGPGIGAERDSKDPRSRRMPQCAP